MYSAAQEPHGALDISTRGSKRITITVSLHTYQALIETSSEQGRSLSNTAAYWLELQADAMRPRNIA
jgi:hypothetical protein